MRNTLVLLSSLALASVAGAQSLASVTATTRATYDAPAGVRVLSLVGETYDRFVDGSDGNFSNNPGNAVQLGHTQNATGGFDPATRTFDLASSVSASLTSTNYGGVTPIYPDGAYQFVFVGYRYFLQLQNTTDADATIGFRVTMSHNSSGSAASPYGRLSFNADGSYTGGAFAEANPAGGVTDRSAENQFAALPNTRNDYRATAYDTSPGVSSPTFGSTNPYDLTFSYTLPKGQIHTYQVYASTSASVQFIPAPVPEPSGLAALGLGTVGLLRRRKRA